MAVARTQVPSRWVLKLTAWANKIALSRRLALGLTIAAIVSGVLTYIKLTGSLLGPDSSTILILIILDLVLVLPLVALIAFRVVRIWIQRRQGSAGSRLHSRLVMLFSIVAVAPAIIVAVFSALLFDLGIQSWFSDKVGTALGESLSITEKYLAEHVRTLRRDMRALSGDIDRFAVPLMQNPRRLPNFVSTRAQLRGLDGVSVFDSKGRVYVTTGISFSPSDENAGVLKQKIATLKKDSEIAIIAKSGDSNIRGVMRLSLFFDADVYLYVSRPIEPTLRLHMARMRTAVNEYVRLEGQRASFQIGFFLLYAVVSLLLLLAAVWLGLYFANQLARPLGQLIQASERVSGGDLHVRVPDSGRKDEVADLGRSFNRMTGTLQRNREELMEVNRQLDARREFTETVLEGVSAGVIGLDSDGRINLPNKSASALLSVKLEESLGKKLASVVSEFEPLLKDASASPQKRIRKEIQINKNERARTLLVQIASEYVRGERVGYVVTFDDISELQQAQRKAAWSDVARRIAHEIKNPLTPIQLSAERLRRKYLDEIVSDRETFEVCTDTIIRQVGDIGRLVDEFSSFARMPAPKLIPENLIEICRQAVFLQKSANSDIDYELRPESDELIVECDRQQITQALTNLLKNAADAIVEIDEEGDVDKGTGRPEGRITIKVGVEDQTPVISVIDNGKGLPADMIDSITEPYVTTREKGTGLGLAIVRKIMEDHGGELKLSNNSEAGATMALVFTPLAFMADESNAGNRDAAE